MFKNNTEMHMLQSFISENEMVEILKELGYDDSNDKFNIFHLTHFWLASALRNWESFRKSKSHMKDVDELPNVDYSTLSKKAKDAPSEFFERLFTILLERVGRTRRRQFLRNYDLYAIDSTTLTFRERSRSWAGYKKDLYAIKLHVELNLDENIPTKIIDTTGKHSDSMVAYQLFKKKKGPAIYIADRAYGVKELLDQLQRNEQSFIIRLKAGIKHSVVKDFDYRDENQDWPVEADYIAYLGAKNQQTKSPYRIVTVPDEKGQLIYLATNVLDISAEDVSASYRKRWDIEVFFRWIKQNLKLPNIFGTTPNAMMSQIYGTLIAYLLLRFIYNTVEPQWPTQSKKMSITEFRGEFVRGKLPTKVNLKILDYLMNMRRMFTLGNT